MIFFRLHAFFSVQREEHKRLCPTCPFIKLGKTQDNCTVKEVIELCQKSLKALVVKFLPSALIMLRIS